MSILAGLGGEIKGVESVGVEEDIAQIAKEFSAKEQCVTAITGREDVVSNGEKVAIVRNGDPMLATVTGTGCMATTAIAGFAAVQKDKFLAAIGGLVTFGLAGEYAAKKAGKNPGTFHFALYDSLAAMDHNDIVTQAKAEIL